MSREWKPGDVARFESGYEMTEGGCWMWLRFLNRDGYGEIRIGGRKVRAHRAAYELHVGLIPGGLVLDHLCRNRACVNPEHLEPVTDEVNKLRGDGYAARALKTGRCINGHPYSPENTYWRKEGGRRCRTCELDRMRSLRQESPQAGQTFTCSVCGEQRHKNSRARHMKTHAIVGVA